MEPEPVTVKVFGGSLVSRWMIGTYKNVAVITDDAGVRALQSGGEPAHAVGFPKSDVFVRLGDDSGEHLTPRF